MGLANGIRCGGLTSSQLNDYTSSQLNDYALAKLNDYTLAPHALAGI